VSAVDNAVICDVIAEISAGIEMDDRFNALFSKGGSGKKTKIFFFRIIDFIYLLTKRTIH
jgi:hypothetical protein